MTNGLRQKLIREGKYSVGHEKKEMYYYNSQGGVNIFFNWHKTDNREIEVVYIYDNNLLFDGEKIEDRTEEYRTRILRKRSSSELGARDIANLFRTFAKISGNPRGDVQKHVNDIVRDNVFYLLLEKLLRRQAI